MLPIVSLEIEGKKSLFYADKRLNEYRSIYNPHVIVNAYDVDGDMDSVIRYASTKTTKKLVKHGLISLQGTI
jgi:hypothetical protein